MCEVEGGGTIVVCMKRPCVLPGVSPLRPHYPHSRAPVCSGLVWTLDQLRARLNEDGEGGGRSTASLLPGGGRYDDESEQYGGGRYGTLWLAIRRICSAALSAAAGPMKVWGGRRSYISHLCTCLHIPLSVGSRPFSRRCEASVGRKGCASTFCCTASHSRTCPHFHRRLMPGCGPASRSTAFSY